MQRFESESVATKAAFAARTQPPPIAADQGESRRKQTTFRDQWVLSAEGVTHAPIDVGLQLGLKTPFGLRLSGGIGWVPDVFIDVLTDVAASASSDARAQAVFEHGRYEGKTWRVQFGVQPFRAIGLYLDAGYSRLDMTGALALSETGVRELVTLGGSYTAETRLHLWLVELGYQTQFAKRLVAAAALGVVGTFDANTTFASQDGAAPAALLAEIARTADSSIEAYGIVPTLSLRLGFDLL
jgi:hypothetical protein